MANTQGMPDEVVEDLLMNPSPAVSSTTSKSSSSSSSLLLSAKTKAQVQLKNKIQERMDMPMTEGRPAATVIRTSPRPIKVTTSKKKKSTNKSSATTRTTKPVIEKPTNPMSENSSHVNNPPMLLGGIVERPAFSMTTTAASSNNNAGKSRFAQSINNNSKKPSRFAQSRINQSTGFPSVKFPIGTFVNKKNNVQHSEEKSTNDETSSSATTNNVHLTANNNNNGNDITKETPEILKTTAVESTRTRTTSSSSSSSFIASSPTQLQSPTIQNSKLSQPNTNNNNNNAKSSTLAQSKNNNDAFHQLQNASSRDAESMLAQMSQIDIQEKLQEVKQSISPEMIAFLKQRGAKKKHQQQKLAAVKSKNNEQQKKLQQPNHGGTIVQFVDQETEKKKIAEVISTIQTYDDLDAAYVNHVKGDVTMTNTIHETEDFSIACKLLRSSSPRQVQWAARVVRNHLLELCDIQKVTYPAGEVPFPFPTVLPVALRCLLDPPHNTNDVLQTHVLESLYVLLRIRANDNHVLDVRYKSNSDCDIYQEVFGEDSIPVPPLHSCYPPVTVKPLVVEEGDKGDSKLKQKQPAAYATSAASSSSAEADGQAFSKDPMWTLLSRMRVIPRISLILESSSERELPLEDIISICGILSMLCQRSPGAATAIVQHSMLVPKLLELTISSSSTHGTVLPPIELAWPALVLLCTIARQSRVAAEALSLNEILLPLLATKATNENELNLQRRVLILWRTMLRYGLGLSQVSPLLTLSAPHFALGQNYPTPFALTSEYLTCFAGVFDCVRMVQNKSAEDVSSSITQEQLDVLSVATKWMSSIRHSIINPNSFGEVTTKDVSVMYQQFASRLRFASAYMSLTQKSANNNNHSGEVKIENPTTDEDELCLNSMISWIDNGIVEAALEHIAWSISITNFEQTPQKTNNNRTNEAAACAFFDALVTCFMTIYRNTNQEKDTTQSIREHIRQVEFRLSSIILTMLKIESQNPNPIPEETEKWSLSRQGWINQSNFAICKFLSHVLNREVLTSSSEIRLLRNLNFSLLGRLREGQEATAAVLFSSDALFQPNGNPLEEKLSGSAAISSFFLQELCGSEFARKQLDHSFKLQHGYGITSNGFGPLALESLLSTADQKVPTKDPTAVTLILPIGTLWLPQALSGSIQFTNNDSNHSGSTTREAIGVVQSCLSLILELEEESDASHDSIGYISRLPLGAKLYYIMNVCLHPEDILRDESVALAMEALIDRYMEQLDQFSLHDFASVCLSHTDPTKRNKFKEQDDKLDPKDQRLMDMFNPDRSSGTTISADEIRALEVLVEDLSKAYNDYGAQYDFFTKCIRVFLLPHFPAQICCRTITELRGITHLLGLPQEAQDDNVLLSLITRSLSGGLSTNRDSSELLDMAATLLKDPMITRNVVGYLFYYAISLQARNLAMILLQQQQFNNDTTKISSQDGGSLAGAKSRLLNLSSKSIVDIILQCAAKMMTLSSGSKQDLANIVLVVVRRSYSAAETATTKNDDNDYSPLFLDQDTAELTPEMLDVALESINHCRVT